MKKFTTVTTCLIYLLISSCSKRLDPNPEISIPIENQPISKQFAYVKENLLIIMQELAPAMKKREFIDLIHTEVDKKFDGSSEVLIKTLINNPVFSHLVNTPKMRNALNAFSNIAGDHLYPQIYIPNYNTHKLKRQNSSERLNDEVPQYEFVFYDGNEVVTEVPSYIYNEEGQVVPTGTIANEYYSLNNEIFIISINESVQNDGEVPAAPTTAQGTSTTLSPTNMKMEWVYVKAHKESWLAGDSEVHIKAIGSTWNHRIDGNPNAALTDYNTLRYAESSNYKGHEIKKVPRSAISSGVGSQYYINYPLNTDWNIDNFYSDPIAYTYVIFEYDAWPAGVKVTASEVVSSTDPNGQYSYISYRSSDGAYGGLPNNENLNYAIYGNVTGLPTSYQSLYYDNYHFYSSTLDFITKKY